MIWLLLGLVAQAASFDPRMTWRSIETEHFRITFHQGIETVADEFAQEVEAIYDTMTEEVRWRPRRRTEVVLVDRTDFANGYARTIPYNAIVIYVTAPQEDSNLELYDDWSTAIMTHELTHILHLDANHGIVRLTRALVGRIASTNDVSPGWMIEGFATFQETRHSQAGRGRSPLADMIKRTAVVEDAFPPLGNLDGLQPKPPGGNLRYLFGQDFIQFVADEVGHDAWTKWVHTYGGWVPYWLPTKRVFGRSLRKLYKQWREELKERYAEQLAPVEALGVTPTRMISDPKASCGAPRFSPDGNWLVWSCRDLRTGSAIWRSDGQGYAQQKLVQDRGAKNFTWRSDSKAFVYAGAHTVNRFNTWSDIYLYDVGSGGTRALTNGARARDPDFSPDGSRLITVTNQAELNQLEVSTVDRRREQLTELDDHVQLSTPRHSPDGKVLAVSQWEAGRRDLWIYGLDGTPLRRLTLDRPADRDPVWSHDGRWLYFSSDRTGIPNIFAIEVETERLYQVTNVRTGATKPDPSPDGSMLAFQLYTNDGWEVHIADVDRSTWVDHGPLPRPMRYDTPLRELVDPVEPPEPQIAAAMPATKRRPARRATDPQQARACNTWRSFDQLTPGVPAPRSFRDRCLQSPGESIDNFDMTDVDDAFGEEEEIDWHIQPKRYNPLPTLLPRYYLPFVQTTPFAPRAPFDVVPFGVRVSAVSSASDMLQHFAWSASANFRTDANALSGGFALTFNRYLPVFSIGTSSNAIPASRLAVFDPTAADPEESVSYSDAIYWERRHSVFASVAYPYRPRTTVFASYNLSWRSNLDPLPSNAYLPLVPIRGRVGTLSGGWRYSWSQPTSYAISLEDGRIFSFIGSVTHPWLGTSVKGDTITADPTENVGLTVVQLTSELREYVVNPLIPNHVLAAKLGGGYTLGANQFLGNYQLGGNIGDGAFISAPDNSRMLRGYSLGSDIGDRYWLASAEYRFPIAQIQRGWDTLPFYFRNISGAFFVDAGNAFGDIGRWQEAFDGSLVGVGAEISSRWAFGWGGYATVRIGYGVGLTPVADPTRRRTFDDPRSLYFQLGGSF